MRVWIVNPYGNLPSEGWRSYRSSMIADALIARGHQVIWWISDFEHRSRTYRSNSSGGSKAENLVIKLVHSSSYSKNISIARIFYEWNFGRNFLKNCKNEDVPDIVILVSPSLFYSFFIIKYVKKIYAKLVVDILDLWPELFLIAFPRCLRKIINVLFFPLYILRSLPLSKADGIVAVTDDYMSIVNSNACSKRIITYLGVNPKDFENKLSSNYALKVQDFVKNSACTFVYAGTFGAAYDISALVEAVVEIITENLNSRFIFIGAGPEINRIIAVEKLFPNQVICLGSVPAEFLPGIYDFCDIGICSYSANSTVSMPVKFYDYLAAGLCVISSLEGEIHRIINESKCGVNYRAGDVSDLTKLMRILIKNRSRVTEFKEAAKSLSFKYNSILQHQNLAIFLEEIAGENK